jgi:hypothetical protein
VELSSLNKQLRGVEAKLRAETEASSQYIKELKIMQTRATEALKDVLPLHVSQITDIKNPADLLARTMDVVMLLVFGYMDKTCMVEVKGRKQIRDSWPFVVKAGQEGVHTYITYIFTYIHTYIHTRAHRYIHTHISSCRAQAD